MILQPQHLGLFFNLDLIQATKDQRETDPISKAMDFLRGTTPDDPLASATLNGLRYQFLDDETSGSLVINALQNLNFVNPDHTYRQTLQHALACLNVAETVRQHPTWGATQTAWLKEIHQYIEALNDPPDEATLLDGFWLGALDIGAAIVFEDEAFLQRGTDIYQMAIDDHIHPEGYLKGIVDEDELSDTYLRQVLGSAALVLMAEMAHLAGVDLWDINNRGITPITATTYAMYYYYYPEKWKWETALTTETTRAVIQAYGAFIEMVNRRSPIRGIDIMFDDERPLFSLTCGGLATLTHGTTAPEKKKRWRLFG